MDRPRMINPSESSRSKRSFLALCCQRRSLQCKSLPAAMAKLVTDYTALEILKHVARQELFDFHKVYVQTEPGTEKTVPQWDEQYLCIGYKEVFLIKCRVLQKDIKGKEPKRGDDDAGGDGRREAEIDSDSEENADHMPPVIIFRFPYVAIQSIVVPSQDDYGFVINLVPHQQLLDYVERYQICADKRAYNSLLPDEYKDDEPDDEKVDFANPAQRRQREQARESKRIASVKEILVKEWKKLQPQLTIMTLLRLPVIQSLRATYKTDSVMRENTMLDVGMSEDAALRISPFKRFQLIKAMTALKESLTEANKDRRLIDKIHLEAMKPFFRANYHFTLWDQFTDTAAFDTERLYSSYLLPEMTEDEKKEYDAKKVRPPGFGKDDYIPLAVLKPRAREERRMEWSRELVIKIFPYQSQQEPSIDHPNQGSSDLIFASSLEYMAAAIANDQCAKSYRDALIHAEALAKKFPGLPAPRVVRDERFFVVSKEAYKKEISIVNDPSVYVCYKVHIVTRDRQIALMGVRRKFMPPDAFRQQDLVFVLVGRKLKLYTKLEIDQSDGALKDEAFDPEELQEFTVPLERLVDSLTPLEMHPEARLTSEAYKAYRAVQDQIAEYPMSMLRKNEELNVLSKKFAMEEKALRALKKSVDAFEMANTRGMSAAELQKHNDDLKKTNDEFMRTVTKARDIEKERDRIQTEYDQMDKEKPAKMTALFDQTDQMLADARGLQFAWQRTEIYQRYCEDELRREEKKKKGQAVEPIPWYNRKPDVLERRNHEPFQITAYDANMINARLNALLFDAAGFAWCREQGYQPTRKLKAIREDRVAKDAEKQRDIEAEKEDNFGQPLPKDDDKKDEIQDFDDDTQSDIDLAERPGEDPLQRKIRLDDERNKYPEIAARRVKQKLKLRRERVLLRKQQEKLIDNIPRRSLHEWAQRFARAALNCVRPNVTDKIDKITKEKSVLSGKKIWKVEERMMRLWSPAEEWAKCVLALEETYNLSLAPQDKQTWMQRLALYFTDVLVAGWELEDDSKPRGTRVYLNDLLTKPVPHTQTLDEYQKTHPGKVGQTLEVRKDFLRETVLELLMQPSVRYTPPKPQSAGEFQHLWWWTPERQAPFIKGYQYVGSVYVKLLEMWALSNKMVAIEAEERVKASGAEEDDLGDDAPVEEEKDRISNKPKAPEFPPYPPFNVNETLVLKLLDTNYLRWDVMLQDMSAWKKTSSALPFNAELLEVLPEIAISSETQSMLERKPWTQTKFEKNLTLDQKEKLFKDMTRKLDDRAKVDTFQLEGDERQVWMSSHIDIQLADLKTAIEERGKIIPPFLASLLVDRNYNHTIVLSVCNWICRTAKFAVPDETPPTYDLDGNLLPKPERPYFEMNMKVVAKALMKLARNAGPVIVAAAYRALTAIAADKEQTFLKDVFNPRDNGALLFLRNTMHYLTAQNTNSLVIAAAANFGSILVSSGETFYEFFIQLDDNEEPMMNLVLPALNRLLLPVMHGERHEGKLLAGVCRFVKRLAGNDKIRPRMWTFGFVGSLAELLFQWDKYFNAMEQCIGSLTNLLYKLPLETIIQLMPPRWDAKPNYAVIDTTQEDEDSQVAGQVVAEALKSLKGLLSGPDSQDDKAAREAAQRELAKQRQEAKQAKRESEEKRRHEEKKRAAAQAKLDDAPVRPNDLKRALKGICLLLSRSAARIHRENGLLALRNATFRDPALDAGLDEKDIPFQMNPVLAFLMRECELETILNQLYSGYANVEDAENEPQFDEATALVKLRQKTSESNKVVLPSRTRAREMDMIRLLLGRITEFKKKWLEIKGTEWVL